MLLIKSRPNKHQRSDKTHLELLRNNLRIKFHIAKRKEVTQMDALVDGLLEELNCDVVFKIPIFGGIPIYESVVVTWIIMAAVFYCAFSRQKSFS